MNFGQALEALKQGKKVTRSKWVGVRSQVIDDIKDMLKDGEIQWSYVLTEDWMIVE